MQRTNSQGIVRSRQTESDSCLIAKLENYIRLSNSERALILRLEEERKSFPQDHVIWRQGEEADSLYVVHAGWIYGYSILQDGRRQIMDIYYPGDVLGLRDIVFDYSPSAVATVTDVTLCPFPKEAMDDVFSESSRLATLLYSLGMLENMVVIDRLKMASCLDARELVCYFLLQMYSRLRITNPDMAPRFHLPLTQEEIGDALGLTQVHINRTLRRLEEENLVGREDSEIELLDLDTLRKISSFEDRHYRIDTTWFPRR